MDVWPNDLLPLQSLLRERGVNLGASLTFSSTTGSTNEDAKEGARKGAVHGAVWLADQQRHGLGRQGRSWSSNPGESVLCSILLRGAWPLEHVPHVALLAGLSVRHAVANALPLARVQLKWPNDVLVSGRKIAGILVEAQSRADRLESVVLGFGVNVHTQSFPDELGARATSLALAGATSDPTLRAKLVADVLEHLDARLGPVLTEGLGSVLDELRTHDALLGKTVRSDEHEGEACGIDEQGRLLLRTDDGKLQRLHYGEVHLHAEEGGTR